MINTPTPTLDEVLELAQRLPIADQQRLVRLLNPPKTIEQIAAEQGIEPFDHRVGSCALPAVGGGDGDRAPPGPQDRDGRRVDCGDGDPLRLGARDPQRRGLQLPARADHHHRGLKNARRITPTDQTATARRLAQDERQDLNGRLGAIRSERVEIGKKIEAWLDERRGKPNLIVQNSAQLDLRGEKTREVAAGDDAKG